VVAVRIGWKIAEYVKFNFMSSYFFIDQNGRCVKINADDILYIERGRNYISICTGEKKWEVSCAMKEIEPLLPACFCRVHKSYIVAIQKITSFDKSNVYMAGDTIPMEDEFRDGLLEKVMLYLAIQ
jgi:DNA-binding LytR/AlgR family response regulator